MAKSQKTKLSLDKSQLFTLKTLIDGAIFENNEILKSGDADQIENAEHRLAYINDLQDVIDKATGFDKVKAITF